MGKKFFNKRINSKKRNIINCVIIGICITGVILCCFITQSFSKNKTTEDVEIIVSLQEKVSIDLGTESPSSDIFFLDLSGVSEEEISIDYSNVDFNTLGEYTVLITVLEETYEVVLNIVDASAPTLILTNVAIEVGQTYNYMDFVSTCTDNTDEPCEIKYYEGSLDQQGNPLDYSTYKEEGTYTIIITATDVNGNITYQTTTLTIGTEPNQSTECSYGTSDYNKANILTYSVANNGCAISLDLYQNSTIREPMDSIADTESEKIKVLIDQISGLKTNIVINRSINAIINETGNGFVGYSLYMEVSDSSGSIIVSYYLNESGTRIYIENPYNIS